MSTAYQNLSSRGIRWTFQADGPVSSPVCTDGRVIFGTNGADGTLYALDEDLGMVVWDNPAPHGMSAAPCVAGAMAWIGSWNHRLYAFDTHYGRIDWDFKAPEPFLRPVTFDQGRVLASCQDGRLYAFDARTGVRSWSWSNVQEHLSQPTTHLGTVYVGGWGLFALDSEGRRQWTFPTLGRVQHAPHVVDDVLYCSTWYLYALRLGPREPQLLWTFQPDSHICTSPVVDGDTVFVGSTRGGVYALRRDDGKVRWAFHLDGRVSGPPCVSAEEIIVADASGDVFGLQRSSGKPRWRFQARSQIEAVVLDGRTLYVPCSSGLLHALDLDRVVPQLQEAPSLLDSTHRVGGRPTARDTRTAQLPSSPSSPSISDHFTFDAALHRQRPPSPFATVWERLRWRLPWTAEAVGQLEATARHLRLRTPDGKTDLDIAWQQRFLVHLSASLLDDQLAELNVSLRQIGELRPGPPIAFKVPMPQQRLSRNLPLKEENVPWLHPEDFARLWPAIVFFAEGHGERPGRWVGPPQP